MQHDALSSDEEDSIRQYAPGTGLSGLTRGEILQIVNHIGTDATPPETRRLIRRMTA